MELGVFKPVLTSLVLPLTSLLVLVVVGLGLSIKHKRTGMALGIASSSALWLLSCQGVAVWLAAHALPQYSPVSPAQLKTGQVQAIVVLGSGLYPQAPEYGQAQPMPSTAARLRYGVWLARQTGLPVAFAGGIGWAATANTSNSEAEVAARVALQDYGMALRWLEGQSRDTFENASRLAPMLKRDGITRIALVTSATHMPRSLLEFSSHGLVITPAPTGFVLPTQPDAQLWLPSAEGISDSTRVLRELIGLTVAKLR